MGCEYSAPGVYRCSFEWMYVCPVCNGPLQGDERYLELHRVCQERRDARLCRWQAEREERSRNRWWRRLGRWLARVFLRWRRRSG